MNVFAKLCLYVLLPCWALLYGFDTGKYEYSSPDRDVAITEGTSTTNKKPLSGELSPVFKYVSKGNELKKQYGFMIPKLASTMLSRGSPLNPFMLIRFLPYIMLALQKANAPPVTDTIEEQSYGLDNMTLASTLQNPEKLKELFSEEARGQLAINSVKLLAGPEASAIVDKLMGELKNRTSDKHQLLADIQKSENLKKLFPTEELANEGLNLIDAYMEAFLNSESNDNKAEMSEVKDGENIHLNEEDDGNIPVDKEIQGTLLDSMATFFKVGYNTFNKKMINLSLKADKQVDDWKQMANDGSDGNSAGPKDKFKKVVQNTPKIVLKPLATGHVIMNNHYKLISKIAHTLLLPSGLSMDAFKFICLVTYVMLVAQRANVTPENDENDQYLSELSTEQVIDKLTNENFMSKLFPMNNNSFFIRFTMLKFLAGPDVYTVDVLVDELKKIKKKKRGNEKQYQLTIDDLLKDAEIFKQLFMMKEYADRKMKDYLGIDFKRLQYEIANKYEMMKGANGRNMITRFFRSVFGTTTPKATTSTCTPCIIPVNFHQEYFHQNLDHFDNTVKIKWKQRYFFNKDHLKDDGPVLLIVGGLNEIFSIDLQSAAWIELAKETGALILCLEHRYYGKSQPTEDLSTENLVFLNSEQALADLALFIATIRDQSPEIVDNSSKTKWIAFGSAYGGKLAAQLRLKYPHLIVAAFTTGAPLLPKADFKEFYKVVEAELNKIEGVQDKISEAYELIHKAIKNNEIDKLQQKLNMCSSLSKNDLNKNISYLFWSISTLLGLVVKFGNFDLKTVKNDVINIIMMEKNSKEYTALDRLAGAVDIILDHYGELCLHVDYNGAIKWYKNPLWNANTLLKYPQLLGLGSRQLLFQRCTEFGQFETSDENNRIFVKEFPINFYLNICINVFEETFNLNILDKAIDKNIMFYGGRDIEVSRVLFVTHDQDPWNELGITRSKSDERIAFNIKNESSDGNAEVWAEILDQLKKWLK